MKDDEQRHAAEVLGRVRAGFRQRQSELAALSGVEEVKLRLLEIETLEYVEEPLPASPRPVLGRALVFLRTAFFHLLVKWWARPVRLRQNHFNQVASQLLREIARAQARQADALAAVHRRLEELEWRRAALPADTGKRAEGGEPS